MTLFAEKAKAPGWSVARIADIGRVVTGRTPPAAHPEYWGSAMPFVTPSDMTGTRSVPTTARGLSAQGISALRQVVVPFGVGVSCIGWQMGKAVYVPIPSATNQQINTIVWDPQKVDGLFLYYVMAGRRDEIFRLGSGGSRTPILKKSLFESLPLSLPPLVEQRAIACILGALDDKVELNRQMSRTLEAMAQAFFKSWFVDFDPVVAKAAGRQPFGMEAETAALFPSRFVDSELGPIPEGWRASVLGEVAEEARKQADPGGLAPSTPYIGLEHMPRRSIALTEWGYAADVSSGKHAFRRGDILFGKLRPYFHKVGVAPLDGVCSTDIVVLRAKKPEHAALVFGHASSREFVDYNDAASEGTRMPRTNWERMEKYPVVISCDRSGAEASALFKRFVERIASQIHESRALAALRDALLPKLLSGEIRVKDAEREAERSL